MFKLTGLSRLAADAIEQTCPAAKADGTFVRTGHTVIECHTTAADALAIVTAARKANPGRSHPGGSLNSALRKLDGLAAAEQAAPAVADAAAADEAATAAETAAKPAKRTRKAKGADEPAKGHTDRVSAALAKANAMSEKVAEHNAQPIGGDPAVVAALDEGIAEHEAAEAAGAPMVAWESGETAAQVEADDADEIAPGVSRKTIREAVARPALSVVRDEAPAADEAAPAHPLSHYRPEVPAAVNDAVKALDAGKWGATAQAAARKALAGGGNGARLVGRVRHALNVAGEFKAADALSLAPSV